MSEVNEQGPRILIVEDEFFLATDLKRALQEKGGTIVGTVGWLDQAMELVEGNGIDYVVLDINLHGDMSFELADRLCERGVPFAFVSGYTDQLVPERFHGVKFLAKPLPSEHIAAEIVRQIAGEQRD